MKMKDMNNIKKEYKAPETVKKPIGYKTVFLAVSIDMGKAENWQEKVTKEVLKNPKLKDLIVVNPRRDDWDCVDEKTKAMTRTDIKTVDQLKVGDEILTYNIEDDILEYKPILNLNVYDVDDIYLNVFKRNKDRFYFSEHHRHVSRVSSQNDTYKLYESNDILNMSEGKVRTPSGRSLPFEWDSIPSELIPEGDEYFDLHYALAAWVLSEGSIFSRGTNTKQITIAQFSKNAEKIKRIKYILDQLEINYNYDGRQFKLDSDATDFILYFMHIEKYKIPEWIKNATNSHKKLFIHEYALGDGSFRENGEISYVAFSEKYRKFAEEFQQLAFEAGMSSKLREKTSGFGHPVVNVCFHHMGKKNYSFTYEDRIIYTGKIWCPTTENQTWVAYRNGTPFITGNSSWVQSIKNKKFNEQVTWELKNIENSDYVIVYFSKDSQAPITLMELGIVSQMKPNKVIVYCPDGYHRKGNVDMVCHRYKIKQADSIEDLIEFIGK